MKVKSIIYNLAALLVLLGFAACSPDKYDLGDKDVTTADLVEGTAFSITHDSSNPNIVYLKSLMADRYQVTWTHPQGRSNDAEVELDIPFPGTYEVQFGVETRGGVVYSEPVTFTVDNFYAGFVDNELYTYLTGGVGLQKIWIPDNGNYGKASGPLSYGDPSNPWGLNNFTANWEPGGWSMLGSDNYGRSEFTFDLNNGANVVSKRIDDDGSETTTKGTFLIDLANAQINLTDVELIHPSTWNNAQDAVGWQKNIQIITLNEDQLRLGIIRNPDTSGEGKWYLVFNFVSKDYADNYEAPEVEVFPTLAENWLDFVQPKNDKIITYKMTGFDWYNKDGSAKGVEAVAAKAEVENIQLVLNSGDNSYTFTDINENNHEGSYSVSADGVYTFSPALPEQQLSDDGRAVLKCNDDGTLRLMGFSEAANCDAQTGALQSLNWGSREYDDQGKFYQYMGYKFEVVRAGAVKTYKGVLHFFDEGWAFQESEPVFVKDGTDGDYTFTINGSSATPYGMYIDVVKILADHPNCDMVVKDIKVDGQSVEIDDAAIDRGAGDDGPNAARRYILNPWGATAGDAPKYVFNSSISVTLSIKMDNGTPFIPASEAKKARR